MSQFSHTHHTHIVIQMSVLVVDDDKGQRILLHAILSKEGYNVDTANDGQEVE